MNTNIIKRYKQKLKEIYMVTGIPVAIITSLNEFDLLFPTIKNSPDMNYHAKNLHDIMEEEHLPLHTPMIRHILLSTYYCLIRIDEDVFVQLGPVASHDINFTIYLRELQQQYPNDVLSHHMSILRGAPKVDLNYFIQMIILTTDHLCNRVVSIKDMYIQSEIYHTSARRSSRFSPRTAMSREQLSLQDEIYQVIETGNVERMNEFHQKNQFSSFYFFQENDIYFLKSAFIFYGGICCHYATLGGLDSTKVMSLFDSYVARMDQMLTPDLFWVLLPELTSTLCHMVHELKKKGQNSTILRSCCEYIDQNLYTRITIEDLEFASHASRRTILRHFKSILNVTPSEYISNAKLKEVATLLKESQLNIIDIANILGYSSQSHLNRLFIKKYGCTPLQYRNS